MKILTAVAAGTLALSFAAPSLAAPGSREYNRGYYDCQAGRYDEELASRAYRAGCREAQSERDGDDGGGWGEGSPRRGPPPPGPYGAPGGPGYRGPDDRGPGGPYGGPPRGPGYGGPVGPGGARVVGIPNVKGMEPGSALAAMASYGYRNFGTTVVGGAIFSIYFNPGTRECVQLANSNGRVIDAREIGSHPNCR